MVKSFHAYLADCDGANAMEYAMIASAVGLALMPVLPTLANAIGALYTSVLAGFFG